MKAQELLREMQEGSLPEGHTVRWETRYYLRGVPCTRAVKLLVRRGYADLMFFSSNTIAVNLTERGRQVQPEEA